MNDPPFTLDDFRMQMGMISKLGSMRGVMKIIPGLGRLAGMAPNIDLEAEVRRIGAMIDSMTAEERRDPGGIDEGRRRRIARGSGASAREVSKLLVDFDVMRRMMLRLP